jgi:hypothetical protein
MVYLIENADEICEKFKPNTNILRGKLLRKQLRGRPGRGEGTQSQASDRIAWAARPGVCHLRANSCLLGSRAKGTGAARDYRRAAHDSLQMPVKYEDGVCQSHRQIQALV